MTVKMGAVDPFSRPDWVGPDHGGWRKLSYRDLRWRYLNDLRYYRAHGNPYYTIKSVQRAMVVARQDLIADRIPLAWPDSLKRKLMV